MRSRGMPLLSMKPPTNVFAHADAPARGGDSCYGGVCFTCSRQSRRDAERSRRGFVGYDRLDGARGAAIPW